MPRHLKMSRPHLPWPHSSGSSALSIQKALNGEENGSIGTLAAVLNATKLSLPWLYTSVTVAMVIYLPHALRALGMINPITTYTYTYTLVYLIVCMITVSHTA